MVLHFSDEVAAAQPAATSIIVRESASGPEVLLLRRSEALRHMPGLWVFPGGKVEPGESLALALARELREHVATMISPIAKPASLLFTADLPKTRSGKIMRRLLRDIAEDKQLGDTTTLADAGIVDAIKDRYLSAPTAGDEG